jgi:secondary thiamine-phosphate synthase enzyme
MATYHETLSYGTKGNCDMLDITPDVAGILRKSNLSSGICTIFVSGSTGSIITIEYEEGLLKDFPEAMERIAPMSAVYEHHLRWRDGNGHSHVRASVVGPSLTVPFVDGKLTLGTWQQIALVDFDNKARQRHVEIMFIGE